MQSVLLAVPYICATRVHGSREAGTLVTRAALGATCGTSVFNIRAAQVKREHSRISLVKNRTGYVRVNKWSRELERSDSELSRNPYWTTLRLFSGPAILIEIACIALHKRDRTISKSFRNKKKKKKTLSLFYNCWISSKFNYKIKIIFRKHNSRSIESLLNLSKIRNWKKNIFLTFKFKLIIAISVKIIDLLLDIKIVSY